MTTTIFELIEGLDELVADTPEESTLVCDRGQWKTAHGVSFCVSSDGDDASVSGETTAGTRQGHLRRIVAC